MPKLRFVNVQGNQEMTQKLPADFIPSVGDGISIAGTHYRVVRIMHVVEGGSPAATGVFTEVFVEAGFDLDEYNRAPGDYLS